jgi:dipeptidyl aminopeptidase/acylaminoacyl peptidase
VVQTHGFSPNRFLLDGPLPQATTAFAAQALANAGIVVLQVQDLPRAISRDDQEGPAAAAGYRAAIEQLIADGIADASRVGLIAFSRTGYHALHVLSQYPRLLKAVTISDALQAGYWQYLTVATNRTDAAISVSRLTGGAPEIATIEDWFARNPIYKIGASTAAVLLEETGRTAGLSMWETYAMLRRSGRPVEFVLFPEGSHLLKKPRERLASQGGNVDWFRFWLQGYEDDVPEKHAKYVRWRAMAEAAQH